MVSQYLEKEAEKIQRFQLMKDNVESKFQQELLKFKQEINKRKEKIKKFDAYTTNKKEVTDFKFLRLHQKREFSKHNLLNKNQNEERDRQKHHNSIL